MAEKHKLIIIGSGPAGYTAGIYASRAELAPVVLAGEKNGGQLMNTTMVENWPGNVDGVLGPELMMSMRAQAEKFGSVMVDRFVTAVDFSSRPFKLWTKQPKGKTAIELMSHGSDEDFAGAIAKIKEQEHDYEADAVIVSTGAVPIYLGVPGEAELLGRGVATCAVCDAAFYREKVAFVVGGGDAAVEDTLALAKFASSVTMLVRGEVLRASKIMARKVEANEKVKILYNSEFREAIGENKLEKIKIFNNKTNEETLVQADGVFLAIGHKPATQIFAGQMELDSKGYAVTRQSVSEAGVKLAGENVSEAGLLSFPSMTSVDGVFAAGDVVDFRYRQAITSAGSGCMAALDAERWLESVGG